MNVPFRVGSTAALSNEHLPSPAQFVLVDNTSNQWLYQPDAQRYIAPYAMNITMPLTVASGANMQVAAPPGVTQAAPIAGQQYLAVFSDAEPSGLPYTSQTSVEITDGQVEATITGGTMDVNATVAGGALNANITNATLNATIASGNVDITDVTPVINLNVLNSNLTYTAAQTQQVFAVPLNYRIHGWVVSASAQGFITLFAGPSIGPGGTIYQGYQQAYVPVAVTFSPQASIVAPLNANYIWVYSSVAQDVALTMYYGIN